MMVEVEYPVEYWLRRHGVPTNGYVRDADDDGGGIVYEAPAWAARLYDILGECRRLKQAIVWALDDDRFRAALEALLDIDGIRRRDLVQFLKGQHAPTTEDPLSLEDVAARWVREAGE